MSIINTSYFQTGTDTGDATATASQILSPYTAYVASGKVTGTMPPFSQQTAGTATASDITEGKTAYVNGQKITGTLNWTTISKQLKYGEVSFDGTNLVLPQMVAAVAGTFSWIYNNYSRYITLTAYFDSIFNGPFYKAFVGGYEIPGQEVQITIPSLNIINGVRCFDKIVLVSPQNISNTYSPDDLCALFLIGIP